MTIGLWIAISLVSGEFSQVLAANNVSNKNKNQMNSGKSSAALENRQSHKESQLASGRAPSIASSKKPPECTIGRKFDLALIRYSDGYQGALPLILALGYTKAYYADGSGDWDSIISSQLTVDGKPAVLNFDLHLDEASEGPQSLGYAEEHRKKGENYVRYVYYEPIWAFDVLTDGPHVLKFAVTTKYGGTGSDSVPILVRNIPDKTPPTIQIVSPAQAETVSEKILIKINATDDKAGVRQVEITPGNGTPVTIYDPPYELYWDTKDVLDGNYYISVRAVDVDENVGTAKVQVKVDNSLKDETPPVVEIVSPQDRDTVSKTVLIKVNVSDDGGLMKVKIAAGDDASVSLAEPPYQLSWDTNKVPDGNCSITVVATDKAGNESTAKVQITVQNNDPVASGIQARLNAGQGQGRPQNVPENLSPPEVTITSPADGDTVKGFVQIQLQTSGDIDQIEIQLPSGETAYPMKKLPYQWNWDSTETPDGSCTLKAKVKDKSGNEASTQLHLIVQNQEAP